MMTGMSTSHKIANKVVLNNT